MSRHRRIIPADRPRHLHTHQPPDGAVGPDTAPSGLHRPDCTPLVLTVVGAIVVTIALLLDASPAAQTLVGIGLALAAGGPLVRIALWLRNPHVPTPDPVLVSLPCPKGLCNSIVFGGSQTQARQALARHRRACRHTHIDEQTGVVS